MKETNKKLANAVIEIKEVDYLITPDAALQIEREYEMVVLHRLVDNKDITFPLEEVNKAIQNGITDRL